MDRKSGVRGAQDRSRKKRRPSTRLCSHRRRFRWIGLLSTWHHSTFPGVRGGDLLETLPAPAVNIGPLGESIRVPHLRERAIRTPYVSPFGSGLELQVLQALTRPGELDRSPRGCGSQANYHACARHPNRQALCPQRPARFPGGTVAEATSKPAPASSGAPPETPPCGSGYPARSICIVSGCGLRPGTPRR